MIIIDTGQLIHGSIHFLHSENEDIHVDNIRKVFLKSILKSISSFRDDNVVLAYDNSSWRKWKFDKYKYARKEKRKDSEIDYDECFKCFNDVKEEIDKNFHYKIIDVNGAEADDVVAVLTSYVKDEDIIIVARDKDFFQLHKFPNVKQYDPVIKNFIKFDKKSLDLMKFTHVCKGDSDDGIPNIKEDDDFFYNKIVKNLKTRQKSITKKELNEWFYCSEFELPSVFGEKMYKRYEQNKVLIDFEFIPEKIKKEIIESYENQKDKDDNIYNYLCDKNMILLLDEIQNF